jgi:hypothetical protein
MDIEYSMKMLFENPSSLSFLGPAVTGTTSGP